MSRAANVTLYLYVVMMAISLISACVAAMNTPDVPNFLQYAEPGTTKVVGKITYLYSPFVFQVFGFVLYLLRRKHQPESLYLWLLVILLAWAGAFTVIGTSNAHHALRAAGLLGA